VQETFFTLNRINLPLEVGSVYVLRVPRRRPQLPQDTSDFLQGCRRRRCNGSGRRRPTPATTIIAAAAADVVDPQLCNCKFRIRIPYMSKGQLRECHIVR
jgi:hypothetical protein